MLYTDRVIDLYEYLEYSGGPPASTEDPFNPYTKWWGRRRTEVPTYGEVISGALRDFLFGDRSGEFWRFFLERGLLESIGRPDTDFGRRWLIVQVSPEKCWLTDFIPKVFEDPLGHIEAYCKVLDPCPSNRD